MSARIFGPPQPRRASKPQPRQQDNSVAGSVRARHRERVTSGAASLSPCACPSTKQRSTGGRLARRLLARHTLTQANEAGRQARQRFTGGRPGQLRPRRDVGRSSSPADKSGGDQQLMYGRIQHPRAWPPSWFLPHLPLGVARATRYSSSLTCLRRLVHVPEVPEVPASGATSFLDGWGAQGHGPRQLRTLHARAVTRSTTGGFSFGISAQPLHGLPEPGWTLPTIRSSDSKRHGAVGRTRAWQDAGRMSRILRPCRCSWTAMLDEGPSRPASASFAFAQKHPCLAYDIESPVSAPQAYHGSHGDSDRSLDMTST
ncbi:uncharacterized protein PSFLO_03616 [Pseudozyma flocculosa]|uniref:Uncharacterized protein n=1 Tax=Pseudozyma flocculosa TaxID=84751 RepID=A0A5C3F3W9_9BASI|nr:uncharacterized protein PSFLO_03616 [Pseudozyma flocculosa]